MYQSEQINELASALAKAQSQMEAALKSSVNPFFKSKYSDINSIISASRESLTNNGLAVTQQIVPYTDAACPMAIMTQLSHASGQWMQSIMPMFFEKKDPQTIGKTITYYRRFAYQSLVCIVLEEDDDGDSLRKESVKKAESVEEPKISPDQVVLLNNLIGDNKDVRSKVNANLEKFNLKSISDIPLSKFEYFKGGVEGIVKNNKST